MDIKYKGFLIGTVEGNKNLYWTATRPDDITFVLGTKKAAIAKLKDEFRIGDIPYKLAPKIKRKRKQVVLRAYRPAVLSGATCNQSSSDDADQRL